jgi:hypothetical protein
MTGTAPMFGTSSHSYLFHLPCILLLSSQHRLRLKSVYKPFAHPLLLFFLHTTLLVLKPKPSANKPMFPKCFFPHHMSVSSFHTFKMPKQRSTRADVSLSRLGIKTSCGSHDGPAAPRTSTLGPKHTLKK